jgi:hypothetical protein
MKKILKSIGAIFAGFITIGILSGVTSALLVNAGVFPHGKLPLNGSPLVIIGILGYQAVFYFVGCYVTAKLAPLKPFRHVLILGGLGALLNLLSALGMKDDAASLWFFLVLAGLSLSIAWLCGKLAIGKKKTS